MTIAAPGPAAAAPAMQQFGQALNAAANRFQCAPPKQNIFLNCVPKCGTHLLRNILMMFIARQSWYRDERGNFPFIQAFNWQQYAHVFQLPEPHLCWGHLHFSLEAAAALKNTRMVVLVRDPYDYVLAYARFLMSTSPDAPITQFIVEHKLPYEAVISIVIFGHRDPKRYFGDLQSVFFGNALAWLASGRTIVRYEDLTRHLAQIDSPEAETYFRRLLGGIGIDDLPADWRERIVAGADRRLSWTARENLAVYTAAPDELSDMHKRLVDVAAPGLRTALGYAPS